MPDAIREICIPDNAQISKIKDPAKPTMIDCFTTTIPARVELEQYIEAFYTSPVFKIERSILAVLLKKSSTDEQARALANGKRDSFAAWQNEYRSEHQLIMGDYMGRTKSWLMVKLEDGQATRLFFGTAVMPIVKADGSIQRPSFLFDWLGGFHRMYSKLLLSSARKVLNTQLRSKEQSMV